MVAMGEVAAEIDDSKVFFEDDGPSTTVDDLAGVFGTGVQTGVWSEAALNGRSTVRLDDQSRRSPLYCTQQGINARIQYTHCGAIVRI